jgi:hypothetical protein
MVQADVGHLFGVEEYDGFIGPVDSVPAGQGRALVVEERASVRKAPWVPVRPHFR